MQRQVQVNAEEVRNFLEVSVSTPAPKGASAEENGMISTTYNTADV